MQTVWVVGSKFVPKRHYTLEGWKTHYGGFILEVQYLHWTKNLVFIKRISSTMSVWSPQTSIRPAGFLLISSPCIDRVITLIAWHELLSFMDPFLSTIRSLYILSRPVELICPLLRRVIFTIAQSCHSA